jgi:putative acetyltransferase
MTAETELKIAIEDPSQPEVIRLLRDGEEHSAKLYPAESNHHMPLSALRASHVRFLVARDASGRAVGTGALALNGAWAELKAMWVIPEARGLGVSRSLLAALEARAGSEGVRTLRLETGVNNHAALGLYARAGFTRCDPFGDYRPRPAERLHAERPLSVSDNHRFPCVTLIGRECSAQPAHSIDPTGKSAKTCRALFAKIF